MARGKSVAAAAEVLDNAGVADEIAPGYVLHGCRHVLSNEAVSGWLNKNCLNQILVHFVDLFKTTNLSLSPVIEAIVSAKLAKWKGNQASVPKEQWLKGMERRLEVFKTPCPVRKHCWCLSYTLFSGARSQGKCLSLTFGCWSHMRSAKPMRMLCAG